MIFGLSVGPIRKRSHLRAMKRFCVRYIIENANLKSIGPIVNESEYVDIALRMTLFFVTYTKHFRHEAYYLVPNWEIWF